ncbi:hypothetical protein CORC01_01150 [Colletotrichum orchidophilum]|uniref:Uncharacterized protein n=1 Tax=Colletotrichum orchidophilum TaxID=1209926 RepID=A0A1G4BPN6_9PEZI|nr:uncharacterized protein CORC01_01150 [Colletotrichum orchidophilum]OHF03431.1 hypothetical protein CORC01_01150 [Colletotrichum orchidophilum]
MQAAKREREREREGGFKLQAEAPGRKAESPRLQGIKGWDECMERSGMGTSLYALHHKVTVLCLVWLVAMESSGIISGFWAGWKQKQRYLTPYGRWESGREDRHWST